MHTTSRMLRYAATLSLLLLLALDVASALNPFVALLGKLTGGIKKVRAVIAVVY